MTLDEAITHAKEVASEQRRRSGICTTNDSKCDKFSNCIKCAEEHEQLATWLEELKCYRNDHGDIVSKIAILASDKARFYNCGYVLGYVKAIDDFVTKLKDSLANNYKHFISTDSDGFEWLTTDAVETHIDNIAEQLKVGVSND